MLNHLNTGPHKAFFVVLLTGWTQIKKQVNYDDKHYIKMHMYHHHFNHIL